LWIILDGDTNSVNESNAYDFTYVMLICAGIGFLTQIIGYHLLVQLPNSRKNCNEDTKSSNSSLDWTWFKECQLYQIGFSYTMSRMFVNVSQAYIPFFLQVSKSLKVKT
jgi:hypothetical protein